tara:strand:+ start:7437 stop:8225 length:789 start_codon:yes stop_codon:yes gene_type:complete
MIPFSIDILRVCEGRKVLQDYIREDVEAVRERCANVKAIRVSPMIGYSDGGSDTDVVFAIEKKRSRERGRDVVEARRKEAEAECSERGREEVVERRDEVVESGEGDEAGWICECYLRIKESGSWECYPSVGPYERECRNIVRNDVDVNLIASWEILRRVLIICCGFKTCSGTSTIHSQWGTEHAALESLNLFMVRKPGSERETMRSGNCEGLMGEVEGRNTSNSAKSQFCKIICEKCTAGRRKLQRAKGLFEATKEKVLYEC